MEPNLSAKVDETPGPVVNQANADAYSAID
jgi:hypothetical protein